MNEKFAKRIEEYLSSECEDYSMKFEWRWDEDYECCIATISNEMHDELSKELWFRYDEKKDDLMIELSEDSFYRTAEYDYSVKYFWMLVSPALFPEQ